jgi:hypothetical protein
MPIPTPTLLNRALANEVLRKIADTPNKSGYREAVQLRDLLLMSWVLHHPERLTELSRITWQPDNSGHLFKDASDNWIYHNIHAGYAMQHSTYAIAKPVVCLIEPYLKARPLLIKKKSDSLFYMPSNHMHLRINTLLEKHFGRAVGFSELRQLSN